VLKNIVNREPSILEDEISRVRRKMLSVELDSEEYETLLNNFERLVRLRKDDRSNRVSPDTLAIVAANLLGILIIVGYERGHVIASRGMQALLRTKHQ
jgi:hypothetical protein